MPEPQRLLAVRFDTSSFQERFQLEALRDFVRGVWRVEPLAKGINSATTRGRSWRLGEVVLTDFEHGTFVQIGGRGMSCDGKVQIRLYNSGRCIALFGDSVHVLQPGAVHIFDSDFQGHVIERCAVFVLAIPFETIGYDPSRHGRHMSFSVERPIGRVMATVIVNLFDSLRHATASEGNALADMIIGLFRGVMLGSETDEWARASVAASRSVAMKSFLTRNLQDADLGVDQLCRQFHASRATIYRTFEADGGVDRFVREKRLEQALRDLAFGDHDNGHVSRVARRWNFHDPSQFSRVFRRRYGCAPSDVPEWRSDLGVETAERWDRMTRIATPKLASIYDT